MRYRLPILLLFTLLVWTRLPAQLSPGDLSRAHADLEGILSCTKCHTLGEKVSNEKCLDCHQALKSRIDRNKGYHVSKEVRGKSCASCHSDHHGRNFDMIRFDEEAFDHQLTGYSLEGKHAQTDCRECHKPEYITDTSIKNKEKSFLGLGQACLNCHEDFHQGSLGIDCSSCHNFEAFSPAPGFDHSQTDFALFGKHRELGCLECHPMELKAGKEVPKYSGIAHANCTDCHQDPHRNHLGNDCRKCHTESSFTAFAGKGRFDHRQTGFRLKGRHQVIDCAACHQMDRQPDQLFQDHPKGLAEDACAQCHEDPHEGRFGGQCADCHNEDSFGMSGEPDEFDHSLTDFALEGKHREVDCRACHTEKLTDPLPHQSCNACHEDYHQGDFAEVGSSGPDCAECHTVAGFEPSTYTLDQHNLGDFPLTGAHLATPCFACHLADDQWEFAQLGQHCVDCHENVHRTALEQQYYPDEDCTQCHNTAAWASISFDHGQTGFELEGKHKTATCAECHFEESDNLEISKQIFSEVPKTCVACHTDIHYGQFEKDGTVSCDNCHTTYDWDPKKFNHDETAFPLEGKHREVACAACHQPVERDEVIFTEYKIASFACIDCHK